MAELDARSLREMTSEQLLDELEDRKEAYFNLRFQKAFGQLDDLNAIGRVKRQIARIKTIIRERELAQQKGK